MLPGALPSSKTLDDGTQGRTLGRDLARTKQGYLRFKARKHSTKCRIHVEVAGEKKEVQLNYNLNSVRKKKGDGHFGREHSGMTFWGRRIWH